MKHVISSIFMVTGTMVGAGMLALPSVLGVYGYFSAISILVCVWLINVAIALIFLEANCYFPVKTSFISMSKQLLGSYGEWIAWILCLIFLYALMCAYIAGIADMMSGIEISFFSISPLHLVIMTILMMASAIYADVSYIYTFNRLVVFGMGVVFVLLLLLITPYVHTKSLLAIETHSPLKSLPLVFTSFGFLIVIPSIRSYLNDDIKKMKIAIIVGSLIPLIGYIAWITAVMGSVPFWGESGLQMVAINNEPVKDIIRLLSVSTSNGHISILIKLFVFMAIISSFVGISLGLYDFLADGFNIKKDNVGKLKLLVMTFLIPFLLVSLQKKLFITALGFAALSSAVIFGLYPALLAWSGRRNAKFETHYRSFKSTTILYFIMLFSFIVICIESTSLIR